MPQSKIQIYQDTKAHMRFSKGSKGVGFQMVLSITQSMFSYAKKLDSFRSYQLVETDLLVCMPAFGDRIKVRFDEALCAYVVLQHHQKKHI